MAGEIEGLEETLANLAILPEVATQQNVLRRALVKAAEPIAEAARAMAPDDPKTPAPDLKTSIGVATQLTKRHRGEKLDTVEVYVGPIAGSAPHVMRYASNVEFGTFHASPHPYLRPAFDGTVNEARTILARELKVELEKAVKRAVKKSAKRR